MGVAVIITVLFGLLAPCLTQDAVVQLRESQDACGEKDSTCNLLGKFLLHDTRCWVTCKGQQIGAVGDNSYCHVISGPERGLFKCRRGQWVIPSASHRDTTLLSREKKFIFGRRRRRRVSAPPPNQPPYFSSCPSPIHVQASSNQKTARASWSVSAADPNGGSPGVTQNQGPAPNSLFNEGSTTVQYTARDSGGLTATCVFTVTVTVLRCPFVQTLSQFDHGTQSCSGIEKNIYGSVCQHACDSGYVLQGQPAVTCQSSSTWSSAFPSCQPRSCGAPGSVAGGAVTCPQGHVFPNTCLIHCLAGYSNTGVTSITCTAAGHWSSPLPTCLDTESPKFPKGCPTDLQLYSGPLQAPVAVSWTDPVVTDNSGQAVTLTSDLAQGSSLGVGSHQVNVKATDAQGNEASCYFLVTVTARTCPQLLTPDHSHVTCTSSNVEGSECTVHCDVGFELKGSAKLTCLNTELWDNSAPTCEAILCPPSPSIQHGVYACPNGYQNPAVCSLTCDAGFAPQSPVDIGCQENATWSPFGSCLDYEPPVFVNGCPKDVEVFASALGTDTLVSWVDPVVQDNSNEPVDLQSDVMPNTPFPVGRTVVTYTVSDLIGNTASCQFDVNVTVLYCNAPSLDAPGTSVNQSLNYSCPDGYVYGALCTISCSHSYTLVGEESVRCARDDTTYPPTMEWEWANGVAGRPHCEEDRCPALQPPKNGAVSCHLGKRGWDCLMTCDASWDIPLHVNGHFYCINDLQVWLPLSSVPDCVVRILPGRVRLQTSLFYLVGGCNTSLDALRHLYVTRMSSSIFKDACVNVPSCSASNVEVSCGPASRFRGRRDVGSDPGSLSKFHTVRRLPRQAPITTATSEATHYMVVDVEVHMAYVEGEKTPEDVYQDYLTSQALLQQKLLNEVSEGRMDVGGVVMGEGGGVGPSSLQVDCPPGALLHPHHPTLRRFSCVGCSKGYYLPVNSSQCMECPRGQYSEIDNATSCTPCPPGWSTPTTGAQHSSECVL